MDPEAVISMEQQIKDMERVYYDMDTNNPDRAKLKQDIAQREAKLRQLKSQVNVNYIAKGLPTPYPDVYPQRNQPRQQEDDECIIL